MWETISGGIWVGLCMIGFVTLVKTMYEWAWTKKES